MRNLSIEELVDGLYVQCREVGTVEISPTLYRLVIENSNLFYTVDDGDCKMEVQNAKRLEIRRIRNICIEC